MFTLFCSETLICFAAEKHAIKWDFVHVFRVSLLFFVLSYEKLKFPILLMNYYPFLCFSFRRRIFFLKCYCKRQWVIKIFEKFKRMVKIIYWNKLELIIIIMINHRISFWSREVTVMMKYFTGNLHETYRNLRETLEILAIVRASNRSSQTFRNHF